MGFTEFVVFIAIISNEVSSKTTDLNLKIDKMLGLLFSTIKAKKLFTFDTEETKSTVGIRSKSRMRSMLIGIRFIGRIQRKIRIKKSKRLILNVIMTVNYIQKLVKKR
jgi:hypothetical protein